jgi:hypothetical protein
VKIIRHRRLLIALLVIIVGLLIGVAWLVWPERPKDLTLRLKFVSEVVDGPLFRIEGADKYEIFVKGYAYVQANAPPFSTNSIEFSFQNPPFRSREIHADDLQANSVISKEGWQMQADVMVLVPDDKFTTACDVIKDTWRMRKRIKTSIFSTAKFLWTGYPHMHVISEQIITSEVITNIPPH